MKKGSCSLHSLIADVAVMAEGKTLLVRYRNPENFDQQSGWFIPDDELKHLEHPEVAAKRILKEQVGLTRMEPRLHHIESFQGNDGTWHLAFHFVLTLEKIPALHPTRGVAKAEWFPVDDLPPRSEVAHHGWGVSILKKILKG